MALRKSARVPNSWEDEDWESTPAGPAPTPAVVADDSPTSSAPIIISSIQQPRTLYKPELKILKRSFNPASEPSTVSSNSSNTPEAARNRERERKEKERRYQEVREKIFNGDGGQSGTASPKQKPGKGGNGKKSGKSTPTPPQKSTTEKKKSASPSPPQQSSQISTRNSSPNGGGAVLGFSLNNGTFSAAPVVTAPAKDDWRLRQVALDGKMLESQAAVYGFNEDPRHGEEDGLDWDEFRRDLPGDETAVEKLERLDINDALLEGEMERERSRREKERERRDAEKRETEIKASRAPRGPDANGGRGFGGRGRGKGRGR